MELDKRITQIVQLEPGTLMVFKVKDWLCAIYNAGMWYCGYVRIPEGHPLYEVPYDDEQVSNALDVHGGVTYADHSTWAEARYVYDPILGDVYKVNRLFSSSSARQEAAGWWIGWDTAHAYDDDKWTPVAVVMETMRLLKQLMDMTQIGDGT
jgi:hypothetical protein